ncbi:GNAT family N-acetyltransferase [Sphingomonas sp. PR090111-T3T-6A]|uniref:GNAT family N-acetyltransferase n=1 Tax=Sphingomonas sp. PR090111-T3T-6A TaxID=685778 RepID=UPI000362DDDE
MTTDTVLIRLAAAADLGPLHALVQRAYRGDSARAGWTHEADLVEGQRIEPEALAAILAQPGEHLLVATRDGVPIGCVQVTDRGEGVGYLGLLAVDPGLQAAGLGKLLIAAAEREAATRFGAHTMEMSVIEQRAELLAYYERRGYVRTGEYRPFPIPMTPPLRLMVLAKPLG